MKIAIIGTGYVGLITGACFAELGNEVICVDIDKKKIEELKKGIISIYEPELAEIIEKNTKSAKSAESAKKRLFFSTDVEDSVKKSDVVFICVGTPPKENGEPNLSYLEEAAKEIALAIDKYKVIVEKSTVPVQTARRLKKIISSHTKAKFDLAVNPEFLKEGAAVEDFMHPDRIVIGTESSRARAILSQLYKPFNAPILHTDINSAELIKDVSNAMLAQKISAINLIAQLCEKTNSNIKAVAEGVGLDPRIGKKFLRAGVGFGGSCFPKDLDALICTLRKNKVDAALFEAVREINSFQKKHFISKVEKALGSLKGKKLGVLGLAFKPNTDDVREAPSIDIINALQEKGAVIRAYDPKAVKNAKKILKNVEYCKDAYSAARDADALLILTEWPEFDLLDLKKIKKLLRRPIILDGRNIFDPKEMGKLGFIYIGVGI